MHIHIYACTVVSIARYVHEYVDACIYACMRICMGPLIYAHVNVCIYVEVQIVVMKVMWVVWGDAHSKEKHGEA